MHLGEEGLGPMQGRSVCGMEFLATGCMYVVLDVVMGSDFTLLSMGSTCKEIGVTLHVG